MPLPLQKRSRLHRQRECASSKNHAPYRVDQCVSQRRSHQAARAHPGAAVEDASDSRHKKISVIRNRWAIVQVRRTENDRGHDKAYNASSSRAFNPVLNQASEQKLFGKRRKQEYSGKHRNGPVELLQREAVVDEINRKTNGNRNDGEHEEVRQPCPQERPVELKTITGIGCPVP